MKILFVDVLGSGSEGRRATIDVIGCGPRVIAGVLEKIGLDFDFKPYYDVFSNIDSIKGYDLLMVSAMSVDLSMARRIKKIWSRFNDGFTIIGGPITSDPYEALIKADFDIAFIGEAEKPLIEFFGKFDFEDLNSLNGIKGLSYKIDSEVKINPLRPFMSRIELDSFKPSVKVIKNYWNYFACRIYVEVVRGCSNFLRTKLTLPDGRKCNDCGKCYSGSLSERYYCPIGIPPGCGYCSVPSLFGPSRSRSISSIINEIRGLIEIGCRRFILGASDFLDYGRDLIVEPEPLTDPINPQPNLDVIEDLLLKIKSLEAEYNLKLFFSIENAKPSLVNEDVAKLLGKYLRGTPISIGVETGDENHAIALGRPSTPIQSIKAIKLLRRYSLIPYAYFIHGLPGQNIEIAIKTSKVMEEAIKAGAEKITVYRFTPLPMSAFADFPKAPPSHVDKVSKVIDNKAYELNFKLKDKYIGSVIEAYVIKSIEGNRIIAYPFIHGPVIFIENQKVACKFIGCIAKVKITGVISDRALKGMVIDSNYK